MTGAPVPSGADAVIRFEQTSEFSTSGRRRGLVHAASVDVVATVQPGDNIRHAAEDVQGGSTVLRAGTVLRPQEIGMLAAVGCATGNVRRRQRVAILATGDELVGIDEPVAPGKIRNVNEWTTAALTRRYGATPFCLGIAHDRIEDLKSKVEDGLAQKPDLFLTSAGESVGDFDMVKDVLASGGHMEFWSVAIKPGKPMAFGSVG